MGGLFIKLTGLNLVNIILEVTVRREKVEPAIKVVVEEKQPERQLLAGLGAKSGGDRFVRKKLGVIIHVQRRGFVSKVTDRNA